MRYLDKLLGEANNFKELKTLVNRARDAEATGDKLDDKYMAKFSKTGRFASQDRKQKKRVIRMGSTERERQKAATQADKLVSKVHLRGGGEGDGKPKGKLRLVQHAAYMQLGFLISEIGDAAELDMAAAERTVRQGDRWYNWLKKNMKNAPKRKVNKAMGKLRQAGERADKNLAQAAKSNVRKATLMNMPGQKLVGVPQKKSKP